MNEPPPFLSDEEIDNLKNTILKGYTEHEQMRFIRVCQRQLLDPFSNQLYATRRYTKNKDGTKSPSLTIVTSALGLTAIAVRTGHYDGCETSWAGVDGVWRPEWLSEEHPAAARCIVYHKLRSHPEVGIARWNSYAGTYYDAKTGRYELTDFWARMDDFMLAKCAKAQALRGAFPDQCSQLYITEELQSHISEGDDIDDEEKILENRRREAELRASPPKGATFVEMKKPAPTAAEMAEPAFPEDQSTFSPSAPTQPVTQPPAPPALSEAPDDLDMSPAEAEAGPTQPESPAGPPAGPPAWKEHVIKGLKNDKFFGRRVGDLQDAELAAIAASWIPKVRRVWDEVNQAQKEDCEAFEAAIKYYKMEKPWP